MLQPDSINRFSVIKLTTRQIFSHIITENHTFIFVS